MDLRNHFKYHWILLQINHISAIFLRNFGYPAGQQKHKNPPFESQADYESAALLAALRSCNSLVAEPEMDVKGVTPGSTNILTLSPIIMEVENGCI